MGVIGSILFNTYGKKKKGNKKKKKGSSVKKNVAQKINGEIILSNENITKTYKIVGAKAYCFSKAVEGKISNYVGENVTVFGKVANHKVITIEAVKISDPSDETLKDN